MDIYLKSCPFCGGKARITVDIHQKPHHYNVGCCNASSDYPTCHFRPWSKGSHTINGFIKDYESQEEAAKVWNTRKRAKTILFYKGERKTC